MLLCLLTSVDDVEPGIRRIPVHPTPGNQLKTASLIMVEKVVAAKRSRCGQVIGRLEAPVMEQLDAALAFVLGLTD